MAFDADRFAVAIASLAIALRGELDDPTIELYARALEDVPMHLLEAAAVELSNTVSFFPSPKEWREGVDRMLDRAQRRGTALPAPGGRLELAGEVVKVEEFICPDCDNTGFAHSAADGACNSAERCDFAVKGLAHVHRCENAFCLQRRQRAAERNRRYSMKRDTNMKSGLKEAPVKRGRTIR